MSAHTPGPLEVQVGPHPESGKSPAEYTAGLLRGGAQVFVVVAVDPDRPLPDYLVTAVTGDGPASEANAVLYAAAPDLLEAARRALSEMVGTVAPRDSFTDAVDALDAAITKAEGR